MECNWYPSMDQMVRKMDQKKDQMVRKMDQKKDRFL